MELGGGLNELGGGGWSWVEVDGAGWSWVHGLVIPLRKTVEIQQVVYLGWNTNSKALSKTLENSIIGLSNIVKLEHLSSETIRNPKSVICENQDYSIRMLRISLYHEMWKICKSENTIQRAITKFMYS